MIGVIASLPLRERGLKYFGNMLVKELEMSLPLRERGLKFSVSMRRIRAIRVAPLAGAWIEIPAYYVLLSLRLSSLPLRERGLKFLCLAVVQSPTLSLPLRERGLKFCILQTFYWREQVAPLAGAWIEIRETL